MVCVRGHTHSLDLRQALAATRRAKASQTHNASIYYSKSHEREHKSCRMRSVCLKAVRRMLSMRSAAAVEGWRCCAEGVQRQRSIVLRAAKCIQAGVYGGAFVKWADAAAELRREREESKASAREAAAAEAQTQSVLSRVVRVWSQRTLATSFGG